MTIKLAAIEDQLTRKNDVAVEDERGIESEKAVCECCSRTDVPPGQLARIDSGQMMCKDCFSEFESTILHASAKRQI